MEVFNNQQRSGYEEIVSYGPKWWTAHRPAAPDKISDTFRQGSD